MHQWDGSKAYLKGGSRGFKPQLKFSDLFKIEGNEMEKIITYLRGLRFFSGGLRFFRVVEILSLVVKIFLRGGGGAG